MKNKSYLLFILVFAIMGCSKSVDKVFIEKNNNAFKLKVNNEDFFISGMNWDYFPIGTNFDYSLWNQSDEFIKGVLDSEMDLLKKMGVNSIRQYTGVPPKWITYIYKNFGIYTMLNHSFGRYGLSINGELMEVTQYGDPNVQELLISEIKKLATTYKNTPGLLMYLIGNENNYGLFWEGAETEDIPDKDEESIALAKSLYKLINKAAVEIKKIDSNHPVAMCNGDDLFIDIIANECMDIDIFGVNSYRGISFTYLFKVVHEKLSMPLMFTEFGADAFDAIKNVEDQKTQAYYLKENWKEVYMHAAGFGNYENSIGGFTFQFSDGWWKYKQTENLAIHDTSASWANDGYEEDFTPGINNMNEEWFGVCAKNRLNEDGHYELQPRIAYYILEDIHKFDPYRKNLSDVDISKHFNEITIDNVLKKYNKE